MLGVSLLLFLAALLLCLVAVGIARRSESIHFDFSAGDVMGEVRKLTHTLVGWLILGLLGQGGSLFLLSIILPIVWVFS